MDEKSESKTSNQDSKTPVVDFGLLMELARDSKEGVNLIDIIGTLEMCEIPMSAAVRKLGIVSGVLYKTVPYYWDRGHLEGPKERKVII